MVRKREHPSPQHSECTNPVTRVPSSFHSQIIIVKWTYGITPRNPFSLSSITMIHRLLQSHPLSPHWSVIKPFLTYPTVQFTRANLSHPSISQINKNRMITIQRSMITYQNFLRFSLLYLPSPSHTFFIVGLCSARASRVIISPCPFPLSQFPRFVSLRFILRNPLL